MTRVRPNLFIVGAPKCGTSAMHDYLHAHPLIHMSTPKEPTYFGRDLFFRPQRSTLDRYLACFAGATDERWVGESSTSYLYSASAPGEIAEFSPEAKIMVMLRNPVGMMHSFHNYRIYAGGETILDFPAAIEADAERSLDSFLPPRSYRRCATYRPYLQRYFESFGRERVHVVILEELLGASEPVVARLQDFLELDPGLEAEFRAVNRSREPRSMRLHMLLTHSPGGARRLAGRVLPPQLRRKIWVRLRALNWREQARPPMAPDLRDRLQAEFAPEVARLEELLGRDLAVWSEGSR